MKKNRFSSFLFWILLMGVIIISASFMLRDTSSERLKYSQVVDLFKGEQVKSFVLDESNQLKMELQDGSTVSYKLRSFEQFYLDLSDTVKEQKESGIITDYDMPAPVDIPWWVSLLPYLIMIGLFIALWIFMMNQANGRGGKIGSFGKSHAKTYDADKKRVTFADVAGADEEKEELVEIVQFLKDPAHFSRLGAKIPHGVLLVGPPGTGKTLLAKAVAGEAGVPFFSISGSDFVEMYVGVGASRVRDLFANAKKHPAAIIFIDEIDAVGRQRGAGLGGGHDEREQTLNQLLVEMDGFDGSDGVIVIAATNRPDILDPALLRPGRFDRQVTVNYPDIKGREAILRVHSKGKPFEGDVDLSVIARSTTGFTGADLANLLNEAALLAARRGKSLIGMNDIEDAMIKVVVGTPKKSSVISEKERKLTAYHEAGHAIVGHILQPDIPVHQISIIPGNKGTGGYTMSIPTEDRSYMTVSQMKASIAGLLGGRMAEKLILDDVSTGASNDIQRATNIARNMVTKYGMSAELGPIVFGSEHSDDEVFLGRDFSSGRNYSEQTAAKIDSEIYRIIEAEYNRAERILTEKMDKLHFIAEFLIKNEIMDEGQFKAAMETDSTMEQLEEMKSEQRRRSERENAEQAKRDEEERRRGRDMLWYLWLGQGSPLFAKSKMATFELYLIADKTARKEVKNPFYTLIDDEAVVSNIFRDFGLDPETSHIICGHVPVKVKDGEDPVKCGGKVIMIDGGFSKAYQPTTGIAGYTLISNSYGFILAAHEPLESAQAAIEKEIDIHSSRHMVEQVKKRTLMGDTDEGQQMKREIADLERLLKAYRTGEIPRQEQKGE